MKITKEIVVCDFCQRSGHLTKCKVCGKHYCFSCGPSYRNAFDLDVCKRCEDFPTVSSLMEKYLNLWRKALKDGNKALSKISLRNEKKLLKEKEENER